MTNKAFESAKQKGRDARRAGLPISACPYEDKRNNYRNGNTFSRAFMNAWIEGWRERGTAKTGTQ